MCTVAGAPGAVSESGSLCREGRGSRTGRPPSKGAKVGFALGDVILGAIPYWETELDVSASAGGLRSAPRASVPVRPELRRRGGRSTRSLSRPRSRTTADICATLQWTIGTDFWRNRLYSSSG